MKVLARLPIRLRLTVWYAFALSASMILLSTAIYVSTRQVLYADLDRDLHRNAQSLAERLEHEFDEGESGRARVFIARSKVALPQPCDRNRRR